MNVRQKCGSWSKRETILCTCHSISSSHCPIEATGGSANANRQSARTRFGLVSVSEVPWTRYQSDGEHITMRKPHKTLVAGDSIPKVRTAELDPAICWTGYAGKKV